jgi:glycerol-3-phosphate dehydrogenase (NAD(P)+)
MGTACAILLAERGAAQVTLWVRNPDDAEKLSTTRRNERYLPVAVLPASIAVTSDPAASDGADWLVAAIPTAHLRTTLSPLARYVPAGVPVASVVKGIEQRTFERPSQILREALGPRPVVALCGPSHAEEMSRLLPTSVVAASDDLAAAKAAQTLFNTDRFRVYTNEDLVGVEWAGALKNVVAIAAGVCDGLGYGDNAKAALLTRACVEMSRFGARMGARPDTFLGLAGIGDLMTSCFSPHGRNRFVGRRIGEGATLAQALAEIHGVAEGVNTCRSVYDMARESGVDMPIVAEVASILFEGKPPREGTDALMRRPPRSESRTQDSSTTH